MHGSISLKGQGMRYFKLNKNNELSHIFSETAHFALFVTKATTCYAGGKGKALARKEVTK